MTGQGKGDLIIQVTA